MIKAEHIHDALTLLPEDILQPVDALRRKKRFRWQPLAAVAACACLVAGLWLFSPGATSKDSAAGSVNDGFSGVCDSVTQESSTASYLTAAVLTVSDDHITVRLEETLSDGKTVNAPDTTVITFENLELIPPFSEGQSIRIYCDPLPAEGDVIKQLRPYRIEIDTNN